MVLLSPLAIAILFLFIFSCIIEHNEVLVCV